MDFPPVHAFDTEFFICGLAPLVDQLVTLYFVKENSDHMVVTTVSDTYIYIHVLPIEILDTHCKLNVFSFILMIDIVVFH